MEGRLYARLVNGDGELIAEGPCWLDEPAARATLEPTREPGVLEKERGELGLLLDTGVVLRVSDRPLIHRIRPRAGSGLAGNVARYRFHVLGSVEPADVSGHEPDGREAQEAVAAGAAGEGAPAVLPPEGRPELVRETPAAR